jgi:hypothetical protein
MWNKSGRSDAAEPGKHLVRDLQERREWAPLQPRVIEEIELEESYSRRERSRVTLTVPPASVPHADPTEESYPAWKGKLLDAAALLVSAASVTALVIEEYQRQFPLLRQYPTLTAVIVAGLLGVMTFYGRRLARR